MMTWPTTTALALGRTGLVFIANCLRLLSYPAALAGLIFFAGLPGILSGFTLGEVVAFCVPVLVLSWGAQREMRRSLARVAMFLGTAILILAWSGALGAALLRSWPGIVVATGASIGLAAAVIRSEAQTLRSLLEFVKGTLNSAAYKRRSGAEIR